jgi:sarcosine oxidase
MPISRRTVLVGGAAGAIATTSRAAPRRRRSGPRIAVVGAGVFGAWTARRLLDQGCRVELIDFAAPAHARASSGGETRMTRGSYGDAEIYTRMAAESLDDWRRLSERADLPLFIPSGVLMLFREETPFASASLAVNRSLGLTIERLDQNMLRSRFPQIDVSDIQFGQFEPRFGALLARRGVQTLVARFVSDGGEYRTARIKPPAEEADELTELQTESGEVVRADAFVFACGPWLPQVFPDLIGPRMFVTRQEVAFFRTPSGDHRFRPDRLPGWADFNGGDIIYGFPDIEGRGFKIASDRHGAPMDPDTAERLITPEMLAYLRDYIVKRFPALASAPVSETRVCQYENSSNGDFLIDRHPRWRNVGLVGCGSGHGFKHGPAVGRLAAALVTTSAAPEPRFTLATKGVAQHRDVR